MIFLVLAFAGALAALVVWVGRSSGRLLLTLAAGVVAAAAAAFGALALESTGWRDTDGWIDCNDYCNGWHKAGAAMFWTPVFTGVLLIVVLIVALVGRAARRRGVRKPRPAARASRREP